MVCPTGALHEHSNLDEVQDALNNKSKKVVIQFDPAISVSLAEEFGLKPGKDLSGIVVAALRRIGFDFVFDSTFAADLAVLEIVAELKERIDKSENLPMFSSFCPAWVKYAEQFYPNVIPLLSTCKSPQQIMGTLIKSYFAASQGINQNEIISVAAMPCLARKFEAQRSEMTSKNVSDVDLVLSTRELIRLIRLYGIDIQNIDPNQPDSPFAIRSSAGKLFATAGGSTEAIIRTLHHVITGKEMTLPKITELRSITGVKQVDIQIGKEKYNFIVSSGLTSINKLMESIKSGELNAHFIEIMACPGGCVNGGGQPFRASEKDIKTRSKSIYDIDENETIKFAHNNLMVKELYSKFLEKPGSEKSLMLLHTMFSRREVLL
jgi:iron-only hydrogenase group A